MEPFHMPAGGSKSRSDEGRLVGPWAEALFDLLVTRSAKPDMRCFCAIWDGYCSDRPNTALFRAGCFSYWVYATPLDVIGRWLATHRRPDSSNIPGMVWPEDRRWCVVTPFQGHATYVGGTHELIERLLTQERMPVYEARLDDDFQ